MAQSKGGIKIAAQNKKAYHDYFVLETYEAGIELFGPDAELLTSEERVTRALFTET